jgi:hypothetical protein
MTNFKVMITAEGKHPPEKWAELISDEIVDISADAEETKMKEAMNFKGEIAAALVKHVRAMTDHEQEQIQAGNHDLDLPYETEDYAADVVDEICGLAKGKSFEAHFQKPDIQVRLSACINRNFKSAKLVERHHFHSEKALAAAPTTKKK